MSTKDKAPTGGPWFRVPANLPALEPEEAAAWMVLLGLWHGGHDPSIGEMRRRTGWGAGRMTAFMGKVSAWAAENGAAMPDRRADLKRTLKSGGDGNVIGTAAERQRNVIGTVEAAEKADNKVSPERERNDSGTGAECYRNDSRARVPSQSRFEKEEEEEVPPPPQPEAEPDWEAIQAKILGSLDEARDAEIDGYFTSPIEPPPPPRPAIPARIQPRALPPASPSLAESLARIKQAVEANPAPRQEPIPQRQAPVVEEDLGPSPVAGMDLPTLLGSGAASQRLLRALVAGGLTTAEALERVTFDDLKFMPGVATTGANAIREALGKHGAGLAMDKGRLLLLSRLAADHPKPWPPEVTRADKVALRAGRVRWRTLAEADDFKINDVYRAIEAGRRV